jgi:hypothetical protein
LSEHSLSPPARTSTPTGTLPREVLAERFEEELERLRQARPHLADRIDRAAGLLVVQLASSPRTRPVRCRIRRGGSPVLLVASLTTAGAVYLVDPRNWSCSCPDYHRRDAACKHSISGWILMRAATRKGCRVCFDGWVYLGEDVIDSETGEARTFHNPVRCRRCNTPQPPYLNEDELREWMASVSWKYARTMPKHPHEYTLRSNQDEELFERVCRTIWDLGYDRSYLNRPWRSLDIGDHYVWLHTRPEPRMPVPLEETILINRALRVRERIL